MPNNYYKILQLHYLIQKFLNQIYKNHYLLLYLLLDNNHKVKIKYKN